MATRLALVACSESTEGPWTLAKGNERGIKIVHLVEGERVSLEVKIDSVYGVAFFDQPGSFPLPWERIDKYRVSKEVSLNVRGSPTTVEIILNGKTQNVSRNIDAIDQSIGG